MNVPRTSAEPGQSQPQMGGETGSGRGRTVTTACERCRRRKIRCDGETPCATCRRFRINCVRTQKNDTQALEQRVRQLEAQIAEFNTQSQGHGSGPVGLPSPQPWSSDVQFNVDFGSPGPAVAMDQTFSQFHPGSPSPLEIPSIQVVDYADSMSPVSPVSLSPSPMLRPLAPARPNPISDGLGAGLRPPSTGPAVSPPPSAIPSPSPHHGLMPYLSPRSLPGPSRSRSSSISSLGLDTDWASAPDLSVYGLTDSELESGIFEVPPTSPDTETLQAPTRFEAETLIDKFFIQIQITAYPLAHYPLDRFKLLEFLNIIHHQQVPTLDTGHDWPCSESMARFHVYMAMAVSLRMEKDGRDSTLSLLQKCYRLALKETQEPSFWKQAFAQEAAVLFVLFAQVSGQEYP